MRPLDPSTDNAESEVDHPREFRIRRLVARNNQMVQPSHS